MVKLTENLIDFLVVFGLSIAATAMLGRVAVAAVMAAI